MASSNVDTDPLKEEEDVFDCDLNSQVEIDCKDQIFVSKEYHEEIKRSLPEQKQHSEVSSNKEESGSLHEKKNACNECGKVFGFKGKLNEHLRIHTGEKPFICALCGKTFRQKIHLEKHNLTHTSEKMFACKECGRKFNRPETLKRHMKMHSGDKIFACLECGDYFTQKANLDIHIKVHASKLAIGTKYETSPSHNMDCANLSIIDHEKTFNFNNHPTKRRSVSLDEKPYACSRCGKRFTRKGHLVNHEKTHFDEKFKLPKKERKKNCKENVSNVILHRQEEIFLNEELRIARNPERAVIVKRENYPNAAEPEMEYEENDPLTLNHDEILSCKECDRAFDEKKHLDEHIDCHVSEKRFVCKDCGEMFNESLALEWHMRTHIGDKLFICAECRKGFSQRFHLETHMKIHTDRQPSVCDICGEGFIEEEDLNMHVVVHAGPKPYTCSVCGKGFTRKDTFSLHKTIHTGQKLHECDICGKLFKFKGRLLNHKITHKSNKVFIESHFDGKDIELDSGNSDLSPPRIKDSHISNEGSVSPVSEQLEENEQQLSSRYTSKLVVENSQNCSTEHDAKNVESGMPVIDNYICKLCCKTFNLKDHLVKHMGSHNVQRRFECDQCEKKFSKKATLTLHKRTHTGTKLFACSECGKTFLQKGHFRVHMRKHTGDRPFPCEVCGRAYIQKNDLDVHMRIHTGERPFTCTTCGKSFGRKCILDKHQRTHTNERPFACHYCGKTFKQKSHVDKHEKCYCRSNLTNSDVSLQRIAGNATVNDSTIIEKGSKNSYNNVKIEEDIVFCREEFS